MFWRTNKYSSSDALGKYKAYPSKWESSLFKGRANSFQEATFNQRASFTIALLKFVYCYEMLYRLAMYPISHLLVDTLVLKKFSEIHS